MAGASGMSFVLFAVLALAGTVAALILIRVSGETLADPVDAVLAYTAENWVWVTIATVVLTMAWLANQRRRAA
jgi:membrane protein DedA with SNARE-associated domain